VAGWADEVEILAPARLVARVRACHERALKKISGPVTDPVTSRD